MNWDPLFGTRSAMLSAIGAHAAALSRLAAWPSREALQSLVDSEGVANARGAPLRLVAPSREIRESYEARVYGRGELEFREDEWHDVFNVLAWLAFPKTKSALNRRHVEAARAEVAQGPGANRGRVRDALTLFDESGALFACADADLVEALRAFRWKRLFRERRERFRESVRVHLVGHGLMEKALAPYVGLTAHALPLLVPQAIIEAEPGRQRAALDALAAEVILGEAFSSPRTLAPLPVLGVPGWWDENEREAFYENTAYFRPGRHS
jgi:hypothetical protein